MIDVIYKVLLSFLFLISVIWETNTTELPRPRGVSIARAPLYKAGSTFVCLDGSLTIPYTQINDDYCDCPDGSDEPGTAACPNGMFHCTNTGYQPKNIPSSRVNDGICDCCDASDEYANSASKCIDECFELGKSARVEAQRRAELVKAGSVKRAEMSDVGKLIKNEKKERLEELQKNKEEAEKVKEEKEKIKKEIEELENIALEQYRQVEAEAKQKKKEEEEAADRKEATEQFERLDSNQDGLIQISEIQTRNTFDKDRNGEVSEEEAMFFLDNAAISLEDFINTAWPKMKPFLMLESGIFKPPSEHIEETEDEQAEDIEEDHPGDLIDEHTEDPDPNEEIEHVEEHETEKEEEEIQQQVIYNEETQKLIDQATEARNDFSNAERAVRDIQSEISNIEDHLNKDYGPEEEYASLHGECFEYRDREYLYKLCPFDKVIQQPKDGGAETRLGIWSNWSGPDENLYSKMVYDKGATCWNGPQRSTNVYVTCGIENQIVAVSEPNRCEYEMHFRTPAACNEHSLSHSNQESHDEL